MELEEVTFFRNTIQKQYGAPQNSMTQNQFTYTYIPMPKTSTVFVRQSVLNDQQVHLKKKHLRMLIIFLCAAINFGK